MAAVPTLFAVARPELLIDAAEVDELQVTCEERSWVELSLNVAVAVNCWVVPAAIDAEDGVTAMEETVAGVMLIETDFEIEPDAPVMVALPEATPVASPEPLIETTEEEEDDQFSDEVRSWVEPSLNVPVA